MVTITWPDGKQTKGATISVALAKADRLGSINLDAYVDEIARRVKLYSGHKLKHEDAEQLIRGMALIGLVKIDEGNGEEL